jgi:hypothetical protein
MRRPQKSTDRLKATKSPIMLDIAWAAGIVEGEGNFNRGDTTERINVTQKDKWLLYRFQELFGGSIWTNTRGVSRWSLTGQRARGFTMTIFSFLSPRRRIQARAMFLRDFSNYEEPSSAAR